MKRIRRTHSLLVILLLAPVVVRAADGTWNVDANGNWSDPSNWSDGVVADAADSTAHFTSGITADRAINLDSNRTIGSLVFSDNGVQGERWLLGSDNGAVLTLAMSGGTPIIDTQTPTTISATLAGTQGLHISGNSILMLSGANTYSGGTILSGDVYIASDSSLGDPAGDVTLRKGGELRATTNLTVARDILLDGGGVISADFGYQVRVTGNISASDSSTGLSISRNVALDGINTYQGQTAVIGQLKAVDGIGLPSASNLWLNAPGASFLSNGIFTRGLGTGPGEFQFGYFGSDGGGFSAVDGPLILRIGGGTDAIKLENNLYFPSQTAPLRLNNSVAADNLVDFQNDLDLGSTSGARDINVGDNPSSASDAAQISGNIIGMNSLNKRGFGTLILTGTNSYGRTIVGQGTLQVGNGGESGTLGTLNVSLIDDSSLVFNRSNSFTITNSITGGSSSALIVQKGTGRTALTGSMTAYHGTLRISAGTLLVNTTVGDTADVIVDGGTLGGTGSLGTRPVTINTGGTLAPGASIGMFHTGSVSFTAIDSRFSAEIDLGPTLAADLLNVSGAVSLANSALDVTFLNLPTSQTFPLTFLLVNNDDADAVVGQFGTIYDPIGFGVMVDYAFTGLDALGRIGDGNDIAVTIVPVAEPSTLIIALLAGTCLLRREMLRKRIDSGTVV